MKNLCPLSNIEFNNLINIKFNNITDGLNSFNSGILEPINTSLSFEENEVNFMNFFKKALIANDNYAVIDFYINNLTPEEILILINALDYTNKLLLIQELKNLRSNSIYFSLDNDKLMDFITILNTSSLFFCTVYFKNLPFTIWGNYDLKFPVFFNDIETFNFYKELAITCGLTINSIILK